MSVAENFPCFSIVLCMAAGILSTPMKGRQAKNLTLAAVTLVAFLSLATLAHVLFRGSSFVYTMGRFPAPWGNELLKSLGIEKEYEGIGHCALGYAEGEPPEAAARKAGRVYYIK